MTLKDPRTKDLGFIPSTTIGNISRSALQEEGREALRDEYLRVKARQKELAAKEIVSNGNPVEQDPKVIVPEPGPISHAPGFSLYGNDDDLFVPAGGIPLSGPGAIVDDLAEFNDWMSFQEAWTTVIKAEVLPPGTATVGMKILWQYVDILAWWATHEAEFPTIAQIARRYLACPASQSFQERVFSGAKLVMAAKRCNMKPSTFEQLTILRHNKVWLREKRDESKKRKAQAMTAAEESTARLVKKERVGHPSS